MSNQSELQVQEITTYTMLQLIKQANHDHPNEILDYQIAVSKAKLEAMGINLEDITLIK